MDAWLQQEPDGLSASHFQRLNPLTDLVVIKHGLDLAAEGADLILVQNDVLRQAASSCRARIWVSWWL